MSTGFLGGQPAEGFPGGQWRDALPGGSAGRVSAESSDAVTRALAGAGLRRFVERPVVPPAVLTTFGVTGLALVLVPAMTMTRLPESPARTATASATGYVLAVVAMACGAVVLALTATLAGRTIRLRSGPHVAAIVRSVAVCAAAPDELTRTQRAELVELLGSVAEQLRRLSDPASADRVEALRALLEGHGD